MHRQFFGSTVLRNCAIISGYDTYIISHKFTVKYLKYNFRTRSKKVNFCTLNILLAERKAALLGKHSYSSIDKH